VIDKKVIILASGSGTRWGDYLGVPKHLIDIDGEALVSRTIRQFSGYSKNVTLVCPDDQRYKFDGVTLFHPKVDWNREMDKFISSMSLWNSGDEDVVLVYGDVYFTDDAVEKAMTYAGDWKYFCRPWASEITGKDCKEIFAIYIPHHNREKVRSGILAIADLDTATGGWALFRKLTLGKHTKGRDEDREMFNAGCHVVIDDWTEDFDYPQDYDNWASKKNFV